MKKLIDDLQLLSALLEKSKNSKIPKDVFSDIGESYIRNMAELPIFLEKNTYPFISIAWLVRMLYKIERMFNLTTIIESDWSNLKRTVDTTLLAIESEGKIEKSYLEKEYLCSHYNSFFRQTTILSLPYKMQEKLFFEDFVDIPSEVYWDFQLMFSTLPPLIEEEYFSYETIAWTIRTYMQVRKCLMEDLGYEKEQVYGDIFANHPESNKAREFARITLSTLYK